MEYYRRGGTADGRFRVELFGWMSMADWRGREERELKLKDRIPDLEKVWSRFHMLFIVDDWMSSNIDFLMNFRYFLITFWCFWTQWNKENSEEYKKLAFLCKIFAWKLITNEKNVCSFRLIDLMLLLNGFENVFYLDWNFW